MKPIALLLTLAALALSACDGEGLPGDVTAAQDVGATSVTAAPAPLDPAPEAPAPVPPCSAGLTNGQSAVDTTVGCMVIEAGSALQLGPTYQIKAVWVGPRARLCWGDNGDAENPCVDNATDAAVMVPNVYAAPVFSSIPL
jgi:hypothetical protein